VALDADGETQFTISSGIFTYATPTPALASTCNSSVATEKEVWYQFTATASDYLITPNSATFTAYTGTCGGLTQIGCGNGFIISNLTPGQIVYLRAFNSGSPSIRELVAADECPGITLVPSVNPSFSY
jgi:hypothetical protein